MVMQKNREQLSKVIPQNFSQVNEKLYRGSWPNDLYFLSVFSINEVVTLYSASDNDEAEWIDKLERTVSKSGTTHSIFDIRSNEDLWPAAQHISHASSNIYVHCQAGANRTSMVCLISEIIRLGPESATEAIPELIKEAVAYGFDYHKEKYKQVLSDILTQATKQGLIFNWFLP
jgi:protein-tyrosine phosphatase